MTDVDYYVRQLWDMKGKLDTQLMNERSLGLFAELSGWTLARAHARSGEPAEIHGYLGSGTAFDRAVTAFAVDYADQTSPTTAGCVRLWTVVSSPRVRQRSPACRASGLSTEAGRQPRTLYRSGCAW